MDNLTIEINKKVITVPIKVDRMPLAGGLERVAIDASQDYGKICDDQGLKSYVANAISRAIGSAALASVKPKLERTIKTGVKSIFILKT